MNVEKNITKAVEEKKYTIVENNIKKKEILAYMRRLAFK